ncbi:MAG: murein hydrolase activator EnvC family protein [Eubacteriales bacterium]
MFYKQRKSRLIILTVLLISMTLIMTAAPAGYFNITAKVDESDVRNIETQLANIENKLSKLEDDIENTESTLQTKIQEKTYIDTKLTLVGSSIEYAVSLVNAYSSQIAAKEHEIAVMEEKIANKYKEFEEWIKMTYENGDVSYIRMILETDNFTDFLSNTERIANIIEYQNRLMKELDIALLKLQQDKEELVIYKTGQETTKATLEQQKAKMADLAVKSANYISDLQKNRTQLEAQKQESEKQMKILNDELIELLEKIAQQNAVYIGGTYMWPAQSDYTRISSGYGYRGREFHLGIDIPVGYGTDVYASNGGKVIKATYHYSYGNYVLIDHGGGQATLYAHFSKLRVSEGDMVSQGDVIGLGGSTGYSTGNHIHFEVRINGVTTDPLEYVSAP